MNMTRIYHGGAAGGSANPGGGGFAPVPFTYPHGLVYLIWAPTINTDLDTGDIFALTMDATSNVIANPTNGLDGQRFTYRFQQQASPGGPITWGANFVFNFDSLGNVLYPKIFFYDYDFVYISFVKFGAFFYMVDQWPDFTHQMSDSSGDLLVENLGGVINIRGEDVSVDRDITIDVTRDFELNSTRYTDINSTEDVVFDFGTSFDWIIGDYCDIDIGDDLNLDVAVDWYNLIGNYLVFNVGGDEDHYISGGLTIETALDTSITTVGDTYIIGNGVGGVGVDGGIYITSNNSDVVLNALTAGARAALVGNQVYIQCSGAGKAVYLLGQKQGATQAGAGAAAGEIWSTFAHASLPDHVLMIGV